MFNQHAKAICEIQNVKFLNWEINYLGWIVYIMNLYFLKKNFDYFFKKSSCKISSFGLLLAIFMVISLWFV